MAERKPSAEELEEGFGVLLDFEKLNKVVRTGASLLPVVVQDVDSGEVLILAYANDLALQHTVDTGMATFWSTSRDELWVKGATSGDVLQVVEIRVNCEQNSLLYLVEVLGEGACHTKDSGGKPRRSCYYRRLRGGRLEFVDQQGERPERLTGHEGRETLG